MPKLENWSLRQLPPKDPYTAPELGPIVLEGIVYGHAQYADGKRVTTSNLLDLNIGEMTAQTRNTEYALGQPDTAWVDWLRENGYASWETIATKLKIRVLK